LNEIIYAIPTFNRPQKQKTLEYLLSVGIKNIILFAQNCQEEYERRYGDKVQVVRTKANSVASNRNAILDYVQGCDVVMMDDDINIVHKFDDEADTWIKPDASFEVFVQEAFVSAKQEGTEAWGIYPTNQPFYMRGVREKVDYAFLIGTVLGIRSSARRFDEQFRIDEDFDFCARILLDGKKVVRYNRWAADAAHRTKGGCKEDWSNEEQYAKLLASKYPQFVSFAPEKKSLVRVIKFKALEELLHPLSLHEGTLF
jgi:glycosyltransferase involved in cell wall biosynthesis